MSVQRIRREATATVQAVAATEDRLSEPPDLFGGLYPGKSRPAGHRSQMVHDILLSLDGRRFALSWDLATASQTQM